MVSHTKAVTVMLLNLGCILKEDATKFVDGLDVEWERKWIQQISKCVWLGQLEGWSPPGSEMGKSIGSAYLEAAGGDVEFVLGHTIWDIH